MREIGQTARLLSRSLDDFIREEGGDERRNATWSVRPAEKRASFSSVVLAGSPLAVPSWHKRPSGVSETIVEITGWNGELSYPGLMVSPPIRKM